MIVVVAVVAVAVVAVVVVVVVAVVVGKKLASHATGIYMVPAVTWDVARVKVYDLLS